MYICTSQYDHLTTVSKKYDEQQQEGKKKIIFSHLPDAIVRYQILIDTGRKTQETREQSGLTQATKRNKT